MSRKKNKQRRIQNAISRGQYTPSGTASNPVDHSKDIIIDFGSVNLIHRMHVTKDEADLLEILMLIKKGRDSKTYDVCPCVTLDDIYREIQDFQRAKWNGNDYPEFGTPHGPNCFCEQCDSTPPHSIYGGI